MRFVRMTILGALLVVLAAGAMACGGDDDGDAPSATATTAAPRPTSTTGAVPQPTATTASGAGGAEATITAADFSFSPSTLTIDKSKDTTITLKNNGSAPHTINIYYDAAYTDALRDTGNVSGGASGTVTIESSAIEEAPQLFFRCNIHKSQMQGTITVE